MPADGGCEERDKYIMVSNLSRIFITNNDIAHAGEFPHSNFQPGFLQHLAWALYKQGKYAEAKERILEALSRKPADKDNRYILSRIEEKLANGATGTI